MSIQADDETLDRISQGDEALAELTGTELRTAWAEYFDPACPLCATRSWEGRPHRYDTHRLLLERGQRPLPRRHFSCKVRSAERAWRKETGEKIRMEELLARELVGADHPKVPSELAPTLGVRPNTIKKWARWLGLNLPKAE